MTGGTTAVVTGIGVVAANGVGTDAYWKAALRAQTGIRPISRFDASGYPVSLAGEASGFDESRYVPERLLVQTDRWTHMALAAADFALADAGVAPAPTAAPAPVRDVPGLAGLTGYDEYETAVVTSSSSGGTEFGQREIEALWSRGPRHVGAYQSIAWFYAATTGQLSVRHGMRGPCGVMAAEEAGALDALAQSRRVVRDGARLVLSGGTDASLCPYGLVAQLTSGRLSTGGDPRTAYLPFDSRAGGHVPGEGGALLVVEDLDAALRRGVPHIYGEIAGHAATFDPPPGSGRDSTLYRAVAGALDDARAAPEDIGVVFADAAGVPELDRAEAAVLRRVFGPYGVPVTAPKSLTGRLYGGAALDVATALLALRDGIVPPSAPAIVPDPRLGLDLVVGTPRPARGKAALVVARGHGGFNSALVLRAPAPSTPRFP